MITNNSTRINLLYAFEYGIVINNIDKHQKKMKANKKKKNYALEFQPINKDDFIKYIVIDGNPAELKLKE